MVGGRPFFIARLVGDAASRDNGLGFVELWSWGGFYGSPLFVEVFMKRMLDQLGVAVISEAAGEASDDPPSRFDFLFAPGRLLYAT